MRKWTLKTKWTKLWANSISFQSIMMEVLSKCQERLHLLKRDHSRSQLETLSRLMSSTWIRILTALNLVSKLLTKK